MSALNDEAWKTLEVRWRAGFELLMREEQEAIALFWLESEFMNGGLQQFFWNSSGDLAMIALSGLKSLKMPITTKAFESALKYFGNSYPINRDERQEALKAIEAEHGDSVFDEAFSAIPDLPEKCFEAAVDRLALIYLKAGFN